MSPALADKLLTAGPPGSPKMRLLAEPNFLHCDLKEWLMISMASFSFFGQARRHVGILVPRSGIEPLPPALEAES